MKNSERESPGGEEMNVKEENGKTEQGSGILSLGVGVVTETSQGKYREGAGPIILEDRKEGIKIILTGTKLIGPGLSSWYESSDQ